MSKEINQIAVIGLGYIGLPTAAVFAQHGKKVVGVDIDENVPNKNKTKPLAQHLPPDHQLSFEMKNLESKSKTIRLNTNFQMMYKPGTEVQIYDEHTKKWINGS